MTDYQFQTLRLYRPATDGLAFLWIHTEGEQIVLNLGAAGKGSRQKRVPSARRRSVHNLIAELRQQGYCEVTPAEMPTVDVVWPVTGFCANCDELRFRRDMNLALSHRCTQLGLGFWVGSSTGQGTMELAYKVVDADLARPSLTRDVRDLAPDRAFEVSVRAS